jgi:hypothetical protein
VGPRRSVVIICNNGPPFRMGYLASLCSRYLSAPTAEVTSLPCHITV